MRDKYGLVNSAIGAFGGKPLQHLDAENPSGRAVQLNYDSIVDACLGFYPWSFAKMTKLLSRLDETPENGYAYAYQMPGHRLSLPVKVLRSPRRPDEPYKDWTVEGGTLYADAEPLWGVFTFRVDPADWPPVFATAVTYALASALVIPISGNATGVADAMRVLAFGTPAENMRGGWMGQAITADARNQPSRSVALSDNPLADARAG